MHLRWGLLWRKVAGSGKVVSGAPPAVAVGLSSMTITGTLALFAALWARVLKRNKFRRKASEKQDQQQELKNYKYSKRSSCTSFCSRGLRRRGAAGAVPCRRTLPCRRPLPYRKALPCRRALPCRGILPWLLVGLLCSCTNQQTDISKDKYPCAPHSGK